MLVWIWIHFVAIYSVCNLVSWMGWAKRYSADISELIPQTNTEKAAENASNSFADSLQLDGRFVIKVLSLKADPCLVSDLGKGSHPNVLEVRILGVAILRPFLRIRAVKLTRSRFFRFPKNFQNIDSLLIILSNFRKFLEIPLIIFDILLKIFGSSVKSFAYMLTSFFRRFSKVSKFF